MSRLFVDGTAALPLRPLGDSYSRPQLRLVADPPAGGGRLTAARRGPVRLTRRGQLAIVVAVALLAALGCMVLGLMPAAATSSGQATGEQGTVASAGTSVVVQPGDSLWSVATRIAPGVDPRVTVQQLVDRNGLAGTALTAGQVLRLP